MNDLTPHLSIIKSYNLIEYDHDMNLLYYDLKDFLLNKFGSNILQFQTNERIVFLHQDNEFFFNKDLPSFTLYNLQLILRELNIPNYFCILISAIPNYQKYVKLIQEQLVPSDIPIQTVTSLYFLVNYPVFDTDLEFDSINRPFVIMSRVSRFHRIFFMSKIFNQSLQNKGYVSYHNLPASLDHHPDLTNQKNYKNISPCHFLSSIPFVRANPEIILKNNTNRQIVAEFQKTVSSYVNFVDSVDIRSKASSSNLQNNFLKKSLIYIAVETQAAYPQPLISQISLKGFINKRPMLLFGAPGSIAYLKELGFKTFDAWWDEGYDSIDDLESRTDAIIDILNIWANKSNNELQKCATEMQDVLEYNFIHYNTFIQNEKNKISNLY